MFSEALKSLVLASVSVVMAESRSRMMIATRDEAAAVADQAGKWVDRWDTLGKAFLYPAFFSKVDIESLWENITENEDFLAMYLSASSQFFHRLGRVDDTMTIAELIKHLHEDFAESLSAMYPGTLAKGDEKFYVETGLEGRHFSSAQWRSVLVANPWMALAIAIYLSGVETTEWLHISTVTPYTGTSED